MRAHLSPVCFSILIISVPTTAEIPSEKRGAAESEPAPVFELAKTEIETSARTIVHWDPGAVRALSSPEKNSISVRFPVERNRQLDLELKQFYVTSPNSDLIVRKADGSERPLNFDPSEITLLRGHIRGKPHSQVFLALHQSASTGYIDLGLGRERYGITSHVENQASLGANKVAVFVSQGASNRVPDVPLCGLNTADGSRVSSSSPFRRAVANPQLRRVQLAVDTDHEFYRLFDDAEAAATYLVEMYAAVSDFFIRDTGTRIELVFVRIWEDPNDLFNVVEPSPLPGFRSHWENNMQGINRDIAQLVSGRRDYPFGGQASLSGVCTANGYSVTGYISGSFPDPSQPSPYHYDVSVTAHEIGHNLGTGHTHDDGLDSCDDPAGTPQRGSIMSYCSQTWSGQNANKDLYFHTVMVQNMLPIISGGSCVDFDCNMNGVADEDDIANGPSLDTNSNQIPDECEDCNTNGVLDPVDIAGASLDLNGNGIPDECELDCNGNGVPDDKDIVDGFSTDAYGNGVPDDCEEDCNTNGVSDFTELQLNMPLDVNRDTLLDACQDCDNDGTIDLDALGSAHSVWVTSGLTDSPVREFYPTTGVLTQESIGLGTAQVAEGQDLIVTDDHRVLVSSATDNRVMEFDLTGNYVGDLVAAGVGGLSYPTGLLMTTNGVLLVSSRDTDSVLAYDEITGASFGAFVQAGAGGLDGPFGLTLGPNGDLYVSSATNEVIEYDGQTGSFISVFIDQANNGGLDQPRGLTFKGDGNLLVASFGTDEVLEFDGQTGNPLGKWAQVGSSNRLTQDSPWGVRVGPNGHVYVVRTGEDFNSGASGGNHDHDHDEDDIYVDSGDNLHLTNAQIYEFDQRNGNFIRAYIGGNDHGLLFPTGFDFVPGWDLDCNYNQIPDNCDIASGPSIDVNSDGIPDECQIDCNENDVLDRLDIIPFGNSVDCNHNLTPDECDTASGLSSDANSNSIPDECEADCNDNEVPDAIDIVGATSEDCNSNSIPDECDLIVNDCDGNGVIDGCDPDCDGDGIPDACERIVLFEDNFEDDLLWTPVNLGASSGNWQRGTPVDDDNWDYDPASDSDGTGQCWLTQNTNGNTDVDNGAVRLLSPVIDMSSGSVDITYDYFLNLTNEDGTDALLVEINNNSGTGAWTEIARHDINGGLAWRSHLIADTDLEGASVTLTSTMVLRFTTNDGDPQSIVEAGLDAFRVLMLPIDCNLNSIPDECEPLADVDFDCDVDSDDYLAFQDCMAGPDQDPAPTPPLSQQECEARFDFDTDGDVDLEDYNIFARVFD